MILLANGRQRDVLLVDLAVERIRRVEQRSSDVRLRQEKVRRENVEEPTFRPVRHVIGVRMAPVDVDRDDRDEDRRVDQNQGEEKISSEQRDFERRRRNQIDQEQIKHLQSDENRN